MIRFVLIIFMITLILSGVSPVSAQQVLLDQGLRVEGLWCFPLVTNPEQYVYIPDRARLGLTEAGEPQFSLLGYTLNTATTAESEHSIMKAEGGALLHFLVLYETPDDVVRSAERALRTTLKNDKLQLLGPIVFREGRYALVSSILSPKSGETTREILVTGNAPVLEGNKLAFSFHLDAETAQILLQNFTMETPDISIVFDMTFTGLAEAYDAKLLVDWSEVRKTQGFEAGGTIYFTSADVEVMFDELYKNSAIRLISSGSDSAMEALLTHVYEKLLDLLFRRVEPENIPADKRGDFMDAVAMLLDPKEGLLSSRRTTSFGLYAGFQLKDLKTSGTSVLNFNHRSNVEHHSTIAFNIGDFYSRFEHDPKYFRSVNLTNSESLKREIHVMVDGALLQDFGQYINSVTVTMRKNDPEGSPSFGEVVITRENMQSKDIKMSYVGSGDTWSQYEYKTTWSFQGGGTFQTDWVQSENPIINLFAPYEHDTIQLEGTPQTLQERGVRAVIVVIQYPFFGETRKQRLIYKPDQPIETQKINLTRPSGQYEYDYSISWVFADGQQKSKNGKDATGLVIIDEIPDK